MSVNDEAVTFAPPFTRIELIIGRIITIATLDFATESEAGININRGRRKR
jgi:hypothetical protein